MSIDNVLLNDALRAAYSNIEMQKNPFNNFYRDPVTGIDYGKIIENAARNGDPRDLATSRAAAVMAELHTAEFPTAQLFYGDAAGNHLPPWQAAQKAFGDEVQAQYGGRIVRVGNEFKSADQLDPLTSSINNLRDRLPDLRAKANAVRNGQFVDTFDAQSAITNYRTAQRQLRDLLGQNQGSARSFSGSSFSQGLRQTGRSRQTGNSLRNFFNGNGATRNSTRNISFWHGRTR